MMRAVSLALAGTLLLAGCDAGSGSSGQSRTERILPSGGVGTYDVYHVGGPDRMLVNVTPYSGLYAAISGGSMADEYDRAVDVGTQYARVYVCDGETAVVDETYTPNFDDAANAWSFGLQC